MRSDNKNITKSYKAVSPNDRIRIVVLEINNVLPLDVILGITIIISILGIIILG